MCQHIVPHMLNEDLNVHRMCQHIVPHMLSEVQLADEVKMHHRLNGRTWLKMDPRNVSMTFTSYGKSVLLLKGLISKQGVFCSFTYPTMFGTLILQKRINGLRYCRSTSIGYRRVNGTVSRFSADKDEADVFKLLSSVMLLVEMEDDVDTTEIVDVFGICLAEDLGFRHCKGGQKIFVMLRSVWVVVDINWCAKIKEKVEKLAYQLNEEAERTERPIKRLIKVLYGQKNRRQTAGEIARHTTQANGPPISRFTVARRLHGGGLFARRPVRCVPLTPAHRRRRALWLREHRNWRDNEWGRVLCTDESRFSLSSDSHRILIWREAGKPQSSLKHH
ncbi:HTH_Tnp_Tc3_2 domain-containing protein [Trichonephila clavipes]|nr:HTH_Tnp_Tc3_2 domain-containing protein [Trichonephila clavipes]